MKRIPALLLSLLALMALTACGGPKAPEVEGPHRLKVVATVFPAYDFARAAGGEWADVTLLLPPGAETHSYEPTPADILAVQDCDLFLYLGGDSDAWVDTILESVQPSGAVLRMIDCVELLEEETVEGMQAEPGHHHDEDGHEDHDGHDGDDHDHGLGQVMEVDEHVWTSPLNAMKISEGITKALCEISPENAEKYNSGLAEYEKKLSELDKKLKEAADKLNKPLIFGDRFPFTYLAHDYGISYHAAFSGCSSETEPSAAKMTELIEQAKAADVKVIYYIEFSTEKVAKTIAEAVGAKTRLMHSCHTLSTEDLNNGETYISIMRRNIEAMKE